MLSLKMLGCCARPAPAAIENDVIRVRLEREVDVVFDMLRAQLEADGNAASGVPHSPARRRKSAGPSKSRNVAGLMAACPGSSPRTAAISGLTLLPGRWPPVPFWRPAHP